MPTAATLPQLFESDHKDEIREKTAYLPEGSWGLGSLPQQALEAVLRGVPRPPPAPFTGRPRLGVRMVAQENLSRFAKAMATELTSWQAVPRLRAALLLRHLLFLAEDHAASELRTLLPGMLGGLVMAGRGIREAGDEALNSAAR